VKWIRRLKVMDTPMYTRDETSRYTELMPDGKARDSCCRGTKSVILKPSFGVNMQGSGYYEISGLALVRPRPRAPRRQFPPMAARAGRKRHSRSGAAKALTLSAFPGCGMGPRHADEPHPR